MAKKLVDIIKKNPGCIATIDNDCWWLKKNVPEPANFDNWTYEAQEEWRKDIELATSDDEFSDVHNCGYGSGNCYGGDILQALAKIVGITVESV
jgi:hypothetical protein